MPPSAEPMVNPQNIVVTRNERRCSGQNSDVSVTEFGIAPPSPKPVAKRSRTSSVSDDDDAETRLAIPKKATHPISTLLRPKRSASGPNTKAPAMRPASPAPNSGASCVGDRLHSARIAGARKPIAAVSKPSIATIRKQRTRDQDLERRQAMTVDVVGNRNGSSVLHLKRSAVARERSRASPARRDPNTRTAPGRRPRAACSGASRARPRRRAHRHRRSRLRRRYAPSLRPR